MGLDRLTLQKVQASSSYLRIRRQPQHAYDRAEPYVTRQIG